MSRLSDSSVDAGVNLDYHGAVLGASMNCIRAKSLAMLSSVHRDNALRPSNVLTVNLEDYFHVGALSGAVPQRFWQRFEKRVEKNTLATLDLLDECGHRAVFFTVGWLADQIPDLLREVVRRGHQIGSKGFLSRPLRAMDPLEFREDAVRSRRALERACGEAVVGYRIARGWFSEHDLWALDVLASEGYLYDSSLRELGLAGHQRAHRGVFRHQASAGEIWELPISSWRFGPFSVPVSGGNYVRQFPHSFTAARIDDWISNADHPLVFYFHVWELDPDQPRITGVSRLEWLRQYRNLDKMPERIRFYLSKYDFVSPAEYLQLPFTPVEPFEDTEERRAVVGTERGGQPVTIVVPCYNEEATLKYLANTLEHFTAAMSGTFELSFVFVDDGSRDGTLKILNEVFGRKSNCKVVAHERNRGVAAASLTGLRNADTEVVCVLDADCSYDPATLIKMIPMLTNDVDIVTASPYHKEGAVLNVPAWRVFLSRGVSVLYGTMLNSKLATYTACVRVYRKSSAVNLKLDNEGYFGITEILIKLDLAGARIVECPAVLEARVLGFSKMKVLKTIYGHLRLLGRLGLERAAGRFHLRQGVAL